MKFLLKNILVTIVLLLVIKGNAKTRNYTDSKELKESCMSIIDKYTDDYMLGDFIRLFYVNKPLYIKYPDKTSIVLILKNNKEINNSKNVIYKELTVNNYSKSYFEETIGFTKGHRHHSVGYGNPPNGTPKFKKLLKYIFQEEDSKALILTLEVLIEMSKNKEDNPFFDRGNGEDSIEYASVGLINYYCSIGEYDKALFILNERIQLKEYYREAKTLVQMRGLVKLMNGQNEEAYEDFKWYKDKIGNFDYPEVIYKKINSIHKEVQRKKEEERILAIKKKNPYYGRQYELGSLFMRSEESVLEILQPTKVEKVSEVGPLVICDYETEKGWYAIHYMDGRAIKITFLSRKVIPYNEELKKAKYTKYGIAMFDEPKEDDVTYKLGSLTHNFLTTYGKREFFNEGKSGFEQEVFIKIYRKRSDGFISKLPYVYKIEAKDGKVISATFKSKNSI